VSVLVRGCLQPNDQVDLDDGVIDFYVNWSLESGTEAGVAGPEEMTSDNIHS
jgi:hypothetical protein